MQHHNRPHRSGSGSISLHQAASQNIERSMSGVGGSKMVRGASDMGKPRQSSMSSEAGMRRAVASFGLSGLSTPPSTSQQRLNVQPLNNEDDNISRVREKLATYRIAVEDANGKSLEGLLPNEVVPVGVDRGESGPFAANLSPGSPTASMTAQWRFPATPQRSTRAPSERSYLTFHTQNSDITVGTHVFSALDGAIAEDREKKKLHPVMKAKKDLFRRLGKCRFGCRDKKIKCFVSHHQIEDILIRYPGAADDVRWALEHNSDPRQNDKGSPSMQRTASNRPAPFVEVDVRREVNTMLQRTDELFQVSAIPFDTGMDFEAETPLDGRANSYAVDGISGSMVHDWAGGQGPNMPGSNFSFKQNQQQFGPGLGLMNGYGPQSRSIGGAMMQATSSQNGYAGGYQAPLAYTSSNLQSTGYQNTPTFGFVDGEAMSDIAYFSYQEPDQESLESPITDERVLAMKHNSNNGTVYTCTIDDCFESWNASGHMLQHIYNSHPHVQPSSPNPMRAVCVQCWPNKFHSAGTSYCQAGCQQQLETHICGQTSGLHNEVGMDFDMTGPNDSIADGSTMGQQDYLGDSGFGKQFQSFGKSQGGHSRHRR